MQKSKAHFWIKRTIYVYCLISAAPGRIMFTVYFFLKKYLTTNKERVIKEHIAKTINFTQKNNNIQNFLYFMDYFFVMEIGHNRL